VSTDELIDVLDEFGEKTGQVLSKDEVHQKGLWHAGSHLWIYNGKGELLLQLRASTKEIYPDTWDISVAGHLSAGESHVDAGLREAAEELGLELHKADLEFVGLTRTIQEIPGGGYTHHVFDAAFLVRRELDIAKLVLQIEEVAAARWWSLDEFEAALSDPAKAQQFSPRPRYFYDLAITEIRATLKRQKKVL
jgi:isopentenyl-diphosphate delta-isomerase